MTPSTSTVRRSGLIVLNAVILWCVPLAAHDMWIEPTTFAPEVGQVVSVRLRVGQDLLGDPLPLDPSLVNQFVVQDAAGVKPVVRREGGDPAGLLRVASPGLLVIGYRSNPSPIEIAAEKFNQYVKEEGLDAVLAMRASRNETGAAAHELFSRCAKSLVFSGPPAEGPGDRPLGFTLELVAERNPIPSRRVRSSRALDLREPSARRCARRRHESPQPSRELSARTDKDGRVRFKVRPGGMWLIKAVHMVPAPAGARAEWASFWASLTFETRNAAT